jgi:uncharacterized protein YndB with AHSA1/START domain
MGGPSVSALRAHGASTAVPQGRLTAVQAHLGGELQREVRQETDMNAQSPDLSGTFTYTIYIHATAEQLWRGLTDPAMTKCYWRHHKAGPKTFRSDWQKGSTWDLEHKDAGLVVSDPEQVILVSDPCRRLSYTWHSFTSGWAAEVGMDDATAEAWRAEPRSKVSYDIDDVEQSVVKLTVTHDGFSPRSRVRQAISQGWPAVLSSLKTLLETGTALPAT